eukprot:9235929-Pyramimonas_sp.AAC.1
MFPRIVCATLSQSLRRLLSPTRAAAAADTVTTTVIAEDRPACVLARGLGGVLDGGLSSRLVSFLLLTACLSSV